MRHTATLSELNLTALNGKDARVTGLAIHTTQVTSGALFVAVEGSLNHGANYIGQAIKAGAGVILTDPKGAKIAKAALAEFSGALVVVDDPRQSLAQIASLWYARQPECIIGVTGTNGKTSVVDFTRQIWEAFDIPAASLGTMGIQGAFSAPSSHTTPDPLTLHRLLAEMADASVTHLAFEASSHGLAQKRIDGVHLTAAAFTNFSQDHLDYHAGMDDYFNAKAALFERILSPGAPAIIYQANQAGFEMAARARAAKAEVVTLSRNAGTDFVIQAQRLDTNGQELLFSYQGRSYSVYLKLIGKFQAENALTAAGIAISSGLACEQVFEALEKLLPVRGRMEAAAKRANGAAIFVDFAHTPEAISTALKALRPHTLGRLGIVFGAGGDRDSSKRVLMGDIAKDLADFVIVTDDNPRSEDPAQIRADVLEGCPDAQEIGDRAEAILCAIDGLGSGDILLIAGKGHETEQIIGEVSYPFDDVEQASFAVAALEGGA